MWHGSLRQRRHSRHHSNSRRLRFEPLEHRWLLSITADTLVDEADGRIDDGDISLRDAIAAAESGETIDFDPSLDGGTILLTLGELAIRQSMTIDATALSAGLTIDASGNDPTPEEDNGDGSRIFNIDDGDDGTDNAVTIRGLTLTGGYGDGGAGAIRTAEDLTVSSSTISGNTSSGRGGGGGIWASGDLTVTSSMISGNAAGFYGSGGGIWASGDVTVTSSTISGNAAGPFGSGGGILAAGDVAVTSSTISGNASGWFGGGGGGIWAAGDVTVAVENSIVAGNTTGGPAPDIRPGIGGLTVQYSLIGDNADTGLIEAPIGTPDANGNLIGGPSHGIIDPTLGPLVDNGGATKTHALLAGSPAIDAGNPGFAPPPDFDQRGIPRVADGNADGVPRIDMGAFEVLGGDLNGDGEVNGLDIAPFVSVLLNGPPRAAADMNQDGVVNGLDVDPFVCAIVDGCNRTDIPIVGDWNANGTDDIGIFFSGTWQLDANGNGQLDGVDGGDLQFVFGVAGDTPIVGDWNGNGIDEIGVQRGDNIWLLDANGNGTWDDTVGGDLSYRFGASGDIPIAGDWNGDGRDDIGTYREDANWYLDANGNGTWDGDAVGDVLVSFGVVDDKPIVGDWNDDGQDDIGVYRSDTLWFLDANGNRHWDGESAGDVQFQFGEMGDVPVTGDWNGDGTDDIGVYRDGEWFLDANGDHQWDVGVMVDVVLSIDPEGGSLPAASINDNDDRQVKSWNGDRFVDVLINGRFNAAADMNQDVVVNGLDVDLFVAAVVGGGDAAGIAPLSLFQNDLATNIGQPSIVSGAASLSPMVERLGNRTSQFHRRVCDLHKGEDHQQQLINHGAVERAFSRRSRLKGRHRVPTDKVMQRMHQQHALAGDWQTTVERAFGDGADWIG